MTPDESTPRSEDPLELRAGIDPLLQWSIRYIKEFGYRFFLVIVYRNIFFPNREAAL